MFPSVYLTNQLNSQLDQMKRFIAQQKEIIHKQEDALIAFKKEKDDLQTRYIFSISMSNIDIRTCFSVIYILHVLLFLIFKLT